MNVYDKDGNKIVKYVGPSRHSIRKSGSPDKLITGAYDARGVQVQAFDADGNRIT